jgi:Rps23 Pro-64 3,4-dihydroxylase Tpa1-like proline 4-hydroxylase
MSDILNFDKSPIPLEKMEDLLPTAKVKYQGALPFPHIVFDNFFDDAVLNKVISEFPEKNDIDWKNYYDGNQVKLANENEINMGVFTRYFLYCLNSSMFLTFLEKLTGIPNLISDPYFRGGGLHNIPKGGKLGVHIDFNKHQKYNLDRRLNLLIYLNKEWKEEFGGHIELWDQEMTKCVTKVLPIFNRMVIFTTTSTSFHGHPEPLNCPQGKSRKSLALYYYTTGHEDEEVVPSHSTLFQIRPGEKIVSKNKVKIKKFLHRLFD